MLKMQSLILPENKELLRISELGCAGRYRSPGDGQVDFKTIFSKLAQYDFKGWAVMEWECCIKTKKTELKKVPNLFKPYYKSD
jgi:sugar phosphate isomerase/epimerase